MFVSRRNTTSDSQINSATCSNSTPDKTFGDEQVEFSEPSQALDEIFKQGDMSKEANLDSKATDAPPKRKSITSNKSLLTKRCRVTCKLLEKLSKKSYNTHYNKNLGPDIIVANCAEVEDMWDNVFSTTVEDEFYEEQLKMKKALNKVVSPNKEEPTIVAHKELEKQKEIPESPVEVESKHQTEPAVPKNKVKHRSDPHIDKKKMESQCVQNERKSKGEKKKNKSGECGTKNHRVPHLIINDDLTLQEVTPTPNDLAAKPHLETISIPKKVEEAEPKIQPPKQKIPSAYMPKQFVVDRTQQFNQFISVPQEAFMYKGNPVPNKAAAPASGKNKMKEHELKAMRARQFQLEYLAQANIYQRQKVQPFQPQPGQFYRPEFFTQMSLPQNQNMDNQQMSNMAGIANLSNLSAMSNSSNNSNGNPQFTNGMPIIALSQGNGDMAPQPFIITTGIPLDLPQIQRSFQNSMFICVPMNNINTNMLMQAQQQAQQQAQHSQQAHMQNFIPIPQAQLNAMEEQMHMPMAMQHFSKMQMAPGKKVSKKMMPQMPPKD